MNGSPEPFGYVPYLPTPSIVLLNCTATLRPLDNLLCGQVEHYFIDTKVIDEPPDSDRTTTRQLRSAVVLATGGLVTALGSAVSALLGSLFFN
ncbi:hypothetical protein ACIG0D_33975 [Streptomyces sp. NPDC052773]|uniref:hypothetical protein n=1 Tax=Streptomyces sp. NPDC052773 TaxID=3365693 RepID=UPI0037D0EC05